MWVDCTEDEYGSLACAETMGDGLPGWDGYWERFDGSPSSRWKNTDDRGVIYQKWVPEGPAEAVPSELLDFHANLCDDARALMKRKNNDYATADRPFKNFELCEYLGLAKTDIGMAVRLADKLQRLSQMIAGKEMLVKDEGLRDTLLDIVNYTVLIGAYIEGKEKS